MNQGKKEPISSFNEMSKDYIYLEERKFDGETPEEKNYRKAILAETRKEREEQKYKKEMKHRDNNRLLSPEAIIKENLNHQRLRNKLNNKK